MTFPTVPLVYIPAGGVFCLLVLFPRLQVHLSLYSDLENIATLTVNLHTHSTFILFIPTKHFTTCSLIRKGLSFIFHDPISFSKAIAQCLEEAFPSPPPPSTPKNNHHPIPCPLRVLLGCRCVSIKSYQNRPVRFSGFLGFPPIAC